jgi:hypothetical protein
VINSIQLLANKDVEFFTGIELLKNLDVFTFFMNTFGAYDESNDTILISKLTKVKVKIVYFKFVHLYTPLHRKFFFFIL